MAYLRMFLRRAAWTLLPLLSLASVACVALDESESTDHHDHEDEAVVGSVSSELTAASPVSAAVTGSCSTTSVKALSIQLVQEIQCLKPGSMKSIENINGVSLGSAVFPYLQTPAANALIAAQKARGVTLSMNSGLRTLPQQFLLYRWYQTGRCGIGLAAKPGSSNHESGIAIDINDNASWRSAMSSKGFAWLGSSDPVHFDFKGAGTVSMKGLSVKAFQRLWNRNHKNDTIAEDGAYGPDTASRLAQAPVGGFPIGASCSQTMSAPLDDAEEPAAEDPFVPTPDATEPAGGGEGEAAATTTAADETQGEGGGTVTAPTGQGQQGCAAAPGTSSRVFYGTPLALGLLGMGLAFRRRRSRA
jgi:MYXO-CTERM domain-containing protein